MRRIVVVLASGMLLALIPALASASGPHVCKGTAKKPGVLKGSYPDGVIVEGFCLVNRGAARVTGTVEVESDGALVAAFGNHHSRLTVLGDVTVESGAAAVIGCNTTSFPCVDTPHGSKPTTHSYPRITGNVASSGALGVIIHSATIGGSVTQSEGGGGRSCAPPKKGIFALFHSPVYSDYEDNTISGNLSISDMRTCYIGLARDVVQRSINLTENTLGDKDAIEVLQNQVLGNLVCEDNTHVWDSAETGKGLFPRKLERNRVTGEREGQCEKASPIKKGGKSAGGPF